MVRYLTRKTFVNTLGVAGLGLGMLASTVGAPSAMAQSNESQGVDRQLFQDEGELDLSDEELKQLLGQLLAEKAAAGDSVVAFQGDEDSEPVVRRLQDGDEDGNAIFRRLRDAEGVAGGREGLRQVVIQRLHGAAEEGPLGQAAEKRAELYAEFTAALADELGVSDADEVDAAIRIAMMSVIDGRVDEGQLTAGQAEALKFLIATSDVPVPAMGMGAHHGGMFVAAHRAGAGPGGEHMFPGRGGDRERIIEWAHEARSEKSDKKAERGARAEKGRDSSDSRADEDE